MNQSRCGRGGKRAGNNPEQVQVVIAGSSQCSYVLTETQFLVQDDPRIPDRSGEEKGREFSRKGLKSPACPAAGGCPTKYTVLCGFSSKRLDDIQALRASVAWDIVRIAEAAPDAEQCL